MTVEIVTFGVRNFPLICIGCGSNRLNDKEKILKYNNIKKHVQDIRVAEPGNTEGMS